MLPCGYKRLGQAVILAFALLFASSVSFAHSIDKSKKKGADGQNPSVKPHSPSLVTLGAHAFYDYLYPSAHYERALTSWFSLGLTGMFSNQRVQSTSTLLYGGYASANIYLDTGGFHGLWLQGGYGAWTMEARGNGDTERIFRRFILGTLGFRVKFLSFFRLGVAGGVLYQDPAESRIYDYNVHRYMPTLSMDFGITF